MKKKTKLLIFSVIITFIRTCIHKIKNLPILFLFYTEFCVFQIIILPTRICQMKNSQFLKFRKEFFIVASVMLINNDQLFIFLVS